MFAFFLLLLLFRTELTVVFVEIFFFLYLINDRKLFNGFNIFKLLLIEINKHNLIEFRQ